MMKMQKPAPAENAFDDNDDERLAMPMMLVDPERKMRESEPARCRQP
jgi:hypothetical protein